MKSYIQALAVIYEKATNELEKYFANPTINIDVRWANFELATRRGVYTNHTLLPPSALISKVARDFNIKDRVNLIELVANFELQESASNVLALKREILSFGYTSFG
jgi:hypothetical protein